MAALTLTLLFVNYGDIDWLDYPIVLNDCSRPHFLDSTTDLYLFQHVTQHTRFCEGCTSHILDLIFTNMISDLQYFPGLSNTASIYFYYQN